VSESSTLEHTFTFAEIEEDFEKTCTIGAECEEKATWAVWAKHSGIACPFDGYACDDHKKIFEDMWIHISKCGKHSCARCRVPSLTGQLSAFFHAIKL